MFILLLCFLLLSCRTELEYNGPEGEPALYVYAMFDNDSLNYVFVGETTFFLDESKRDCLKDAEVTISVNGEERVKLEYDGDTALYVFRRRIETGDTLRLTVKHPRLGEAEAMAVVPPEMNMEVKEIRTQVQGMKYNNYALIQFSTEDCRKMDGYYFTFEPYIRAEVYATIYDDEHYDSVTYRYSKGWDTITYMCSYYSDFKMLEAEESAEANVDIWNLIFGDDSFIARKFDMKENVVDCKVEFDVDTMSLHNCDSVRSLEFYALMNIYSKDYTEFRQQRDKASSEANNPFVEPTQVKGNVKPTGGTMYAFGCFSITKKAKT